MSMVFAKAFNRTSMELKLIRCDLLLIWRLTPFNRTSMELKPGWVSRISSQMTSSFNRTSMELKHNDPRAYDPLPLRRCF